MTTAINKSIKCDNCGSIIQVNIITSLNVTLNPELRKMTLEEDIFKFKCKNCGKGVKVIYPCLYHDMNSKFMIYYIPDSIRDFVKFDFLEFSDEFKETQKRIVDNLSKLKEEILIFENGLSDSIVYATKFALTQIIKSKMMCQCVRGYFYGKDEKSNELKFIFFVDGEILYKKIQFDVYKKLYETSYPDNKVVVPRNFVYINEKWSNNVITMVMNH